jgi:hypothetical protein
MSAYLVARAQNTNDFYKSKFGPEEWPRTKKALIPGLFKNAAAMLPILIGMEPVSELFPRSRTMGDRRPGVESIMKDQVASSFDTVIVHVFYLIYLATLITAKPPRPAAIV